VTKKNHRFKTPVLPCAWLPPPSGTPALRTLSLQASRLRGPGPSSGNAGRPCHGAELGTLGVSADLGGVVVREQAELVAEEEALQPEVEAHATQQGREQVRKERLCRLPIRQHRCRQHPHLPRPVTQYAYSRIAALLLLTHASQPSSSSRGAATGLNATCQAYPTVTLPARTAKHARQHAAKKLT
jgi:hypothetical protein